MSGTLDGFDPRLGRRGVDELEVLVAYIYTANPNNETDWLEWKVGLDLGTADGQFQASKHLLGFANRHPDQARQHAGGLGHLVLGAEPGNIAGQPSMDPANLVGRIRRYVGTQGPRWAPLWVPFRGKDVLILTVEAPEWGDPMHTLQRAYGQFHEGTIFVRHPGRTDEGSSGDIRMLSERLARQQDLKLVASSDNESICSLDTEEEPLEEWLASERDRLMRPLERPEDVGKGVLPAEEIATFSTGFVFGRRLAEDRSREDYARQVDTYIESCRQSIKAFITQSFCKEDCCQFVLAVENRSDRNIPGVRVELDFGDVAMPMAANRDPVELPTAPRLWGAHVVGGLSDLFRPGLDLSELRLTVSPGFPPPPPDHYVEGRAIVYRVGHLRPRTRFTAEPVALFVTTPDSDQLAAQWTATSDGLDGVVQGEIRIPLGEVHPVTRYLPHH